MDSLGGRPCNRVLETRAVDCTAQGLRARRPCWQSCVEACDQVLHCPESLALQAPWRSTAEVAGTPESDNHRLAVEVQ